MLKIEISKECNASIRADGTKVDILLQSTAAIVAIIEMVNENFGEELPHIDDFIIQQAKKELKNKECERSKKQ